MYLEPSRLLMTHCEYSDANEHSFRKFRAPLSGKTVHVFPEVSAMSIVN